MIALLRSELRAGRAAWAGLVLVAAVAALAFGVAVTMLETGLREGGEVLEGSVSFLSVLLLLNLPSGAIVVAAIARLAVDLHRDFYARWLLAGVGPVQTSLVVTAQLAVAGLAGGVLGYALTVLLAARFLHAVFAGDSSWWATGAIETGPLTAAVVLALTVLVTVLGGLRAALSAGRTPALAALRTPEPEGKRMRWSRWLLLGVVVIAAGSGILSPLRADERSTAVSQLILLPAWLTLILAAAGPVLYPAVLRAWTGLLPARLSSSWHLARHQARHHLGRSTASITPLFVGASLLGGLMTMSATTSASMDASGLGGNFSFGLLQVMLLVGGPVLLGATGAAVVIFMSNRTQGRERALLQACGATDATVLCSALLQAVIHVVTAGVLAGAVVVATGTLTAAVLGRFIEPVIVVDVAAAAMLGALGLLLTASATVFPALVRLHESVPPRLAAV